MAATFLNRLHDDDADALRALGTLRMYPARSFIFYEGDPGNGVLVVESGLLRIDRTNRNGRIVLLDLATSGALIGELSVIDGSPRSATLSSVTDCRVRHIRADSFAALLLERPSIQSAVLSRLARRLRSLSTQVLETATMDAPARIASRLVHLVDIVESLGVLTIPASGPIDLKLPINQEELGQWAGLGREGAVKGLRTLRSIGLIETGRKRVVINDLAALRRFAE